MLTEMDQSWPNGRRDLTAGSSDACLDSSASLPRSAHYGIVIRDSDDILWLNTHQLWGLHLLRPFRRRRLRCAPASQTGEGDPLIKLWQDVISLHPGKDWWLQITDALEHVAYMVLVATPKYLR